MFESISRYFGLDPINRNNAAIALVNSIAAHGTPHLSTPVEVTHAQVINSNGDVRMYTDDGKVYYVTITQIKNP